VIRLSDGVQISEESYQECLSADVTIDTDNTVLLLGANIYGTDYVVNGYILADVTITPSSNGITYVFGTGDPDYTLGSDVTMAAGEFSGRYRLEFALNVERTLTTVSYGGWTERTYPGDFQWSYTDGSGTHSYFQPDIGFQTFNQGAITMAIESNTPFTFIVEVS
jgi:hypothetical protein